MFTEIQCSKFVRYLSPRLNSNKKLMGEKKLTEKLLVCTDLM